jgi:hypothetical protein
MKIRQWCSKQGYQDVEMKDRGDWKFQGLCKTKTDVKVWLLINFFQLFFPGNLLFHTVFQ